MCIRDSLKDATAKILDGTVQLHDANIELNDKMGEFQSKYKEFSDGLNTAVTSSKELKEGAQKLSDGVGQIQTQLTAMLQKLSLIHIYHDCDSVRLVGHRGLGAAYDD